MACSISSDDHFGPSVGHGCRDDFDFTLLFEQSFFQIAPAALLLLIVPIRASQLRRQNVKVLRNGAQLIKQAAIAALSITQLALLVLWTLTPLYRTRTSVPAAVLSFLASLALLYLSSVEHSKSIRPSSIINVWVLFSLLFDIAQDRTLWLRPGPTALPALFTAGIAAKVIILYLEARSKKHALFPSYQLYAPEALVNLYDRTALWWINPLFWAGYNTFLTVDSLYTVDSDLTAAHVERTFEAEWRSRPMSSRWAMLRAIFFSTKWNFLAIVPARLCLSALKLSQPLLIARVTSLLLQGLDDSNSNQAKGLIGAAALIYIGIALTTALYQRELHRFTTKIRGTVVSAVYAKCLRLDSAKLEDNAALTLVTADVNRVCMSIQQIDNLFATPIELAVAIFLLRRAIGVSCVAPVAFTLVVTGISFVNSNTAVPMQKRWLAAVTERVSYTSSVLSSPKGFKMLGLTDYFIKKIQGLRIKELVEYAQYRKYVTLRNVQGSIPPLFAPPLTLMMYTLVEGRQALDPATAFTALALVALVTTPITELIFAVPQSQIALASLDRVQNFLRLDESGEKLAVRHDMTTDQVAAESAIELSVLSSKSYINKSTPVLQLDNISVALGQESRKDILQHINIELARRSLSILVGPVGSGKSILLKVVVGDIQPSRGARIVDSNTEFAYCAQDAWLPNDTIRNIILGQSDFDQLWYTAVIQACALTPDIATFPSSDHTLVGTRGVSLSGGQRQRVALARAVYSRSHILVADDVFSGLDASTSRQVFAQVFGARGLCRMHNVSVLLATHSQQYLPEADHIIALREDGTVAEQGSFSELGSADGYVRHLLVKSENAEKGDSSDGMNEAKVDKVTITAPDKVALAQHDLARKTGDTTVYKYYLKSIGWKYGITMAIAVVGYAFGSEFPNLLVRWWSEDESSAHPSYPVGMWIGLAFFLACLATCSVATHIWIMLVHAVPKSSAQLHRQLLDAVMHATYKFFANTDSGVTLNRFSNDMSIIETELAGAFMQVTDGAAICIAGAMLIFAGADYAAAAAPFLLLVLYLIQKFYLRTSRQLRFLELESQAPLLTHCSETLAGLTTIRAFGWQRQSHQKCLTLLDRSLRANYHMLCIQRWLTLVLGLVTAAIAVVVVAMAMTIPSASSAGAVGVSLLGVLSFSVYLAHLVNAWTNLETALGAVARCKTFETNTESEDKPEEREIPPSAWPSEGNLFIGNLTASYNGKDDVLKSISLSVAAGEKIGICGRSGSGKSSLLLTLCRLLDYSSGRIAVDGVDLETMPRQAIRERITTVPQEILTFPGSVRANLDPTEVSSLAAAETALRKVGLLDVVTIRGGLEADIAAMNLSQGQLQLFAIARALLRPSKMLIVDEMSSSVDSVTEETMVSLIKDEFKHSTVIAVAHRLKTIVDFDRVVVMENGRIVEVGRPEELLETPGSKFRTMWERSWQK